jgi:cell division protein FtsL
MIKRTLVAATAALFAVALISSPASASQCPKDMKKIDAALKKAKLSKGDMAKVKDLRKKGEELHKAGKHKESVETLAEAMKIMKIK